MPNSGCPSCPAPTICAMRKKIAMTSVLVAAKVRIGVGGAQVRVR